VAKFSKKFCEMAIQKGVPMEVVSQHLMSCAELFSACNFGADISPEPVKQFIEVLVNYIHNVPIDEEWVSGIVVLQSLF
jgi:hypothetical protein